MEKLITVVNKIQDVFNTLSISNEMQKQINLPQIVMVGAQSSGKSSTIESLVRHSFLPRGNGIVTRCPLVLHLIPCPMSDRTYRNKANKTDRLEVWGKFNHSEEIFPIDKIRDEIQNQTNILAGPNKGVVKETINLSIYSPHVVDLTIVDLPGMTKISVNDQPKDIDVQIMKMIKNYIENPNSIILAVSSATSDIATSESLKLANEVDPEGKRTLAILTKLDANLNNEEAMKIFNGDMKLNIQQNLGIIGVINSSDDETKKIINHLKKEKEFFEETFPDIANRNGIPYLEKSLSNLLMHHIQVCLPDLRNRISMKLNKYEEIMKKCGEKVTDENIVSLDIINKFMQNFQASIEGTNIESNVRDNKLIGGPAIRRVFDEKFSKELQTIEAKIEKEDIIKYLKKCGGPRPSVFPPEKLFENIVIEQIERLREPSLKCAENVKLEMEKIVKDCVDNKNQFYLKRFPQFMTKLKDVMLKFVNEEMPRTKEFIQNILNVELASINTNHPDFVELKENLKVKPVDTNNNSGAGDGLRKSNAYSFADDQLEDDEAHAVNKTELDAETIAKLINGYFAIEKKKVEDSIPKSIIYTLINYSKNHAQSILLNALYQPNGNKLLVESENVTKMRLDAENMLKALRTANMYIDEVYEIEM